MPAITRTAWRVERNEADPWPPEIGRRSTLGSWVTVYDGGETLARKYFGQEEARAAGSGGRWTEIRLWQGNDLMLHVHWHRPF